ncbi:hypothetical protein [Parapedobacter koreensis]|nr:hypothetical protein [Parapedobacter koreensis]
MLRKVVVNVVTALVGFPIVISIRYWGNLIEGNYKHYDAYYDSLPKYLYKVIVHPLVYPLVPLLFLLFILLPFQLIKDSRSEKGKPFSYLQKVGIFSLIVVAMIAFWGLFTNLWAIPYYRNVIYLAYALGLGLVFATLLYFLVDRYTEKRGI